MQLAKKIFFLVFFVLIIAALFWFQLYSPAADELDSLTRKHASLQKDLGDAERTKKTYEVDRQKRDELSKTSSKQLQMLPPDTEMSSFLENLNAQAELVGLEILSVKPMAEEAARYYARIPVQLKLRGAFHQLSKFFYLVGNLDRIINIENINFGKGEMDDSGVILTAEVLATTFRSVEAGGEAPGAKTAKKKAKPKTKTNEDKEAME
jgi:type IV pilus assembly protein PilO